MALNGPFQDTPTSSTDQKSSRYVQGGLTDVFPDRLGWWEMYELPTATDDITFVVPPAFDKRPDLVAKAVYNQVTLMWLVLQYNKIVDIEVDFRSGLSLTLPSQRRVLLNIISKPTGGNPVTE